MTTPASYVKASFSTQANLADEAAGILVANGALGCAIDAMTRRSFSSRRVVTLDAYFSALTPAKLKWLRRTMASAGMLADGGTRWATRRIVDPGWAALWKTRFEPMRIGRRFLIVPPWKCVTEPGRVSIVVQPGQAFGTGHHPTTAGALRTIGETFSGARVGNALDVGTGSGILSIAMGLLGARKITAIDVDSIALDNARENAVLNHVSDRIRFSTAPVTKIRGHFDLVTANILSATLIALSSPLKKRLAHGGKLILGGILKHEVEDVAPHYRELRNVGVRINRGWATMVFQR